MKFTYFSLYSALSAEKACSAPSLDKGFCVPEQESYPHGTHITYACDDGYKPIVEGWWATITCQNGTWSHDPQCIGKSFTKSFLKCFLEVKIKPFKSRYAAILTD